MGSWYETCALTNLPISGGDKVVCIFAMESSTGVFANACNIDSGFTPITGPISGIYDDYGTLVELELHDGFMEGLNQYDMFFCNRFGENSPSFTNIKLTPEIFWESVWSGDLYAAKKKLYFKSGLEPTQIMENKSKIARMFMHQGAFDVVVNEIANRKPYNSKIGIKDVLISRVLEKAEKISKSAKVGESLLPLFDADCTMINDRLESALFKVFKDGLIESDKLAELIATKRCLEIGLGLMRKGYFINTGTGSQSCEMKLQRLLAKWTIAFEKAYKKKAKEEWDISGVNLSKLTEESIFYV